MINSFFVITYIALLLLISLYAVNSFFLLINYRKKRNETPPRKEFSTPPRVTIQLPIYNEYYVVKRLINSVCEIDYPRERLEIQVLDDSDDETKELIDELVREKKADGFDIKIIRRKNRTGYKAGALKYGLQFAKGEFIAIFDADFVPAPDFLKQTLPYFASNKIGMVQTRWGHLNENLSLLTKLQAFALNNHFVIEQTVRNRKGLFINFNGTGGVWRKECILDAGNWHEDTVAEDVDLSYRAQLKGWKFVYLNNYETKAELPAEINALKSQQFRWAKGTVQAAKKLLPIIWKSGLSLSIKIQATFHLTAHLIFPLIVALAALAIPVLIIRTANLYDMYFNVASLFFFSLFFSFLFFLYAQKELYADWKKKIFYFPIFLSGSMGLALNNSKALFEGLIKNDNVFVRTPKFGNAFNKNAISKNKYLVKGEINFITVAELLLTIYSFAAIITAVLLKQYSAVPINIIYFLGFGSIFYLSLKTNFPNKRGTRSE